MAKPRFTLPWDIEDNGACFIICDNNGQALSYVYYENEPGRRTAAGLLTRGEARQIAITNAGPGEAAAMKSRLMKSPG
jgi:hypothetical protein